MRRYRDLLRKRQAALLWGVSLLPLRPALVPMAAILAASGLAESSLTPWARRSGGA